MNRVDDRGRPVAPKPLPPFPSHPTIDDYERALAQFRETPNPAQFPYLREIALMGARLGTIRPAEIVRHVRPAAVAVTLVMEPEIVAVSDAVARAILRGDSAGRQYWSRMVRDVDTTPGSLAALVKARSDSGRGVIARRPPGARQPQAAGTYPAGRRWRAANVVLALAPPLSARGFLASVATVHKQPTGAELSALREHAWLIQEMASQAPLCRELVEHAFGSLGDPALRTALRMRLAENPYTPDSVLSRLVREYDTEPEVTRMVQVHQWAGGTPRRLAFQAMRDDPGAVLQGLREMLRICGEEPFLAMVDAAPQEEAAWVRSVIAALASDLEPDTLLRAYLRLAEMSSPEVVWAVELARSGSLGAMMPAVRASMADGSAEPLVTAVRKTTAGYEPEGRKTLRSIRWTDSVEASRRVHGAHAVEQHRVATADMAAWRSEKALDDPIPLT
ncbi:hypothetical protein KGQ20_32605 [Catenulispora sp. NF23]|uniref:HEAT repeat domain-containing protein n=1 Tax=Catenulispora pinistramenti TaxID=2705254 RepID=A0ABS5L3E9_9ACTN|nr:hypothetical protein [Catenulispora pinistramenti]MBS2537505.1 hypothetical protein [Catenulispora pinistramenti]MBS2552752.1 hypothetical protein [Catenulispora pinistramenti]